MGCLELVGEYQISAQHLNRVRNAFTKTDTEFVVADGKLDSLGSILKFAE